MCLVPKRCNDMMNVGRLQGFDGKITAQGKLLQQDTFCVSEQAIGFLSSVKEREVFLFEQLVIFSEPVDRKKGFSLTGYTFKNSIKVSCLGVEEQADPCCLILTSRQNDGCLTRFIMQTFFPEKQQTWFRDVVQILDNQRNFLNALQSPIEYQRKENKSHSMSRTVMPAALTASDLRPDSSSSMERRQQPCLQFYNTTPCFLLPPHHRPASEVLSSQPAFPSFTTQQQLNFCPGIRYNHGTQSGLPTCSQHSAQHVIATLQTITFSNCGSYLAHCPKNVVQLTDNEQ
ncbi:triple functional domain protein [Thalassophryne amazonica]|uniref:triple functional domain protein n=1 Tax=Thalassophryne amazonica TaxID=390379 RepID=UPI001471126A|nr:triple functional domain protein [Thalassophryne amazonica]XP_034022569.1 triple functional domain protein [Thalassophryne amazonica]